MLSKNWRCPPIHRALLLPAAAARPRALVTLLLVLTLVASHAPAYAAPPRQAAPTGQYTVSDCRTVDKDALRLEIERHALDVIQGETVPLNIEQLVARQWAVLGVDAAIDAAVARATADLYAQEDYFNRLASGWWGDKAQEYAEQVANAAFSSPEFRAKIEELSAAVGAEVARQVETQFAQAASVALLCLREYVGAQYAATLFAAFERTVQVETEQLDLILSKAYAKEEARIDYRLDAERNMLWNDWRKGEITEADLERYAQAKGYRDIRITCEPGLVADDDLRQELIEAGAGSVVKMHSAVAQLMGRPPVIVAIDGKPLTEAQQKAVNQGRRYRPTPTANGGMAVPCNAPFPCGDINSPRLQIASMVRQPAWAPRRRNHTCTEEIKLPAGYSYITPVNQTLAGLLDRIA